MCTGAYSPYEDVTFLATVMATSVRLKSTMDHSWGLQCLVSIYIVSYCYVMIVHVMSAEMIQIISRPMRQDVPLGNIASFNCVGYGSFLNITWRFDFPRDEQVMCSHESCDHTALAYSERPSSDNLIMNTTLEIDTSQLELGVYSIQCILQQSIPPEIDLEEGMDQPFSTTMRIVEPIAITTLSTTTTDTTTEIMPTAATGN